MTMWFGAVLTRKLNSLVEAPNIEESLDERFSRVYPFFDPSIHFQVMIREEAPKDAPLSSPSNQDPNTKAPFSTQDPNTKASFSSFAPAHDDTNAMDVDSSSTTYKPYRPYTDAVHVDNRDQNASNPNANTTNTNLFTDMSETPCETEYHEHIPSWGRHAGLSSLDENTVTHSMLEPAMYADADDLDNFEGDTERATSLGDCDYMDDEEGEAQGHCVYGDGSKGEGEEQKPLPLPILLKRPRQCLENKENEDTHKRRSARIAAMHSSPEYKI